MPLQFSSSCSGSRSLSFPWCLSLVRLGPRSLLCVSLSIVSDLGSLFRCSLVWAAWFLVLLRVSLPPGEGREYFSVFLVLIASWKVFDKVVFVHLLWVTPVGPWLRLALSGCLVEFLADVVVFAVCRYFTCCGVPARWRDLRHVVFHASEFFRHSQLQIQEAAERRGLHRLRRAVEPRDPQ